MKTIYIDRAGDPITKAKWETFRQLPGYVNIRGFKNDTWRIHATWFGEVPESSRDGVHRPYKLVAWKHDEDPCLIEYFDDEEDLEAEYEDFAVRVAGVAEWLPSKEFASGFRFVEHGNLLKPDPNQFNVNAMTAEQAELVGSW